MALEVAQCLGWDIAQRGLWVQKAKSPLRKPSPRSHPPLKVHLFNTQHLWIQFRSVTQSCLTLCDPMDCSTPGFPVHHQLPELAQTHVHRVGDAIQPSHPLLSYSPPAFNLAQHWGLFQWVSSLHQVAKVLEFQLQHQSSSEYSGLIFFGMDWLDLLAVQGTLKSILQHHSSKASVFCHSAFFIVQLSHPYTVSIVSPSICHEVIGQYAMILVFWLLSLKPAFSLSSFTFIKRLFNSPSLSAIRVVSSAYLKLLIFLLAILIPACASSNLAFRMMYSAYKLNKQGDNIHPWRTPFPIWNQSDLWRAWYILGSVLRARGGGKEDPKRNVKWLLFCRSSLTA